MAPDRDQHWTRSKRTSHIKSFSDSERGGHACCTMAGIVHDAKYLRVVLHSMGLANATQRHRHVQVDPSKAEA